MAYRRYATGADGIIERGNYNSDGDWVGEGPDPRIEFPVMSFSNGPMNHDNRIRCRNPARRARPTYKIKRMS